MCSKSVPICNRIHTIRANNGKKRLFKKVPFFDALVRGEPFIQEHEILSLKTRVLVAAHSENFVILACTVLIGLKDVTDGQTDGRTMTETR